MNSSLRHLRFGLLYTKDESHMRFYGSVAQLFVDRGGNARRIDFNRLKIVLTTPDNSGAAAVWVA